MEITFRFTGSLRNLAGRSSLTIGLAREMTLRGALLVLRELVPADFGSGVIDRFVQGDPLPALLLHNRSHVLQAAQLEQPLGDGDVIAFAEPMEGG